MANYPASRHTLFFRGFFAHVDRDEIRDFFKKDGGYSTVEFCKYSDDGRNLFIALRFDSSERARMILDRYNGAYVLNCRIYVNWYKEMRRNDSDRDRDRRDISPSRGSFRYEDSADRRRNWRPAHRSGDYSRRSYSRSQSPDNRARSNSPQRRRTRSKSGGSDWNRRSSSPRRRSWTPEDRSESKPQIRSEVNQARDLERESESDQHNQEDSPQKKRSRSDVPGSESLEDPERMSPDPNETETSGDKPTLNFSLKSKSNLQKSINVFNEKIDDEDSGVKEPRGGIHRRVVTTDVNTIAAKKQQIKKKKGGKMDSELEEGEIISSHNMDDEWEAKTRQFLEEKCKVKSDDITPASGIADTVSPSQSLPISNKSVSPKQSQSSKRSNDKRDDSVVTPGRQDSRKSVPSPSRWDSSRSRSRSHSRSSSSSRSTSHSRSPSPIPKAYRSRSRSSTPGKRYKRSDTESSEERSPSPNTKRRRTAGWLDRFYKRRDDKRRRKAERRELERQAEKAKKKKEKSKPKKDKSKKKKKDKKKRKSESKADRGNYSSDDSIKDEDLLRLQGVSDNNIKDIPHKVTSPIKETNVNSIVPPVMPNSNPGNISTSTQLTEKPKPMDVEKPEVAKPPVVEREEPTEETQEEHGNNDEPMEVNGNANDGTDEESISAEEEEDGVDMTSFDANAMVGLTKQQMKLLLEKKEEIEKAYRQDCETFATVVRMLISKDSKLEEQLQFSLKENLKELGKSCIVELRSYVEQLKAESNTDVTTT
ncbi:unnamed protein product [Owenia fusiformis]|uniref:RRM domain-containing protein n=1 Tax=Owenia fusiformis TaxID=6347 RepID=A0A8S4NR16_OWEFU|nr:unnamed protein product [Owenia fusiformis]